MGENSTTIRFNVNEADLPPETEMLPNYEMLYTTMIPLQWQVLDNSDDIQLFQIQVRESGSEWQDFNNAIDGKLRQINFYGEFGKTYEFRLRAVDMAGNVESYPSEPETTYTIEPYCNPDNYDFEMADNSRNTAAPIEFEDLQIHNFCGVQDSDWLQFVGTKGEIYQIVINSLDAETRTSLAVITSNSPDNSDVIFMEENENRLVYKLTAEETGVIYLRLASENPLFCRDELPLFRNSRTNRQGLCRRAAGYPPAGTNDVGFYKIPSSPAHFQKIKRFQTASFFL